MTPRSLFIIILKIIGIFFIKNILLAAASILPSLTQINRIDFGDFTILNITIAFLELVSYLLLTYLLLFKTNWIINTLKLDKGFSQEILEINIHRSTILRIAIIVLGGIIIVDSLPLLIQQFIYYIQMKKEGFPKAKIDYIILHASRVLIGIFLISYQRILVNFIEYKQRIKIDHDRTD